MYKICIGRNPDDDGIEGSVPVLIQLPHPRTGQASCYIIRPSEPCLLEVQQADGKAHSWFISNYVQADGSFYTFSPMDPLFLLLPILEKHREKTTETAGRFLSLDDLLHDEICTSLAKLADIPTLGHRLHSISDTSTVPSGDVFYRLNDEKVVAWLQAKAKKLLGNFDTYAFLENSVLGLKDLDESQLKEARTRVVLRVLAEYVPMPWIIKLRDSFGLSAEPEIEFTYFDNIVKRPLSTSNTGGDSGSPVTKKSKLTSAHKALSKVDKTGMKSLSSFFTKK